MGRGKRLEWSAANTSGDGSDWFAGEGQDEVGAQRKDRNKTAVSSSRH